MAIDREAAGAKPQLDAQRTPRVVSLLVAGLGVIYWLCALLLNEFTLGWAFRDLPTIRPELRIALAALDGILLVLGLSAILGRRTAAIVKGHVGIIAVAASVVSVEFILRAREVLPSEVLIAKARLRRMHPSLHHALRENVESFSKWGNAIVAYSTNNLGFRDRVVRHVAKAPSEGRRVLILGDSFSEALGVEFEDAFPFRLQELLRDGETETEVLNAGIVSYSPRFEYRQLREFFERGYVTDVVVLMLDISDIGDEGKQYIGWDGYSDAERESKHRGQQQEIEAALSDEADLSSLLYPRILKRIRADETKLVPRYERIARFQWTEQEEMRALRWVDAGIAICSDFIGRIDALCAERKVAFYLGIYPHPAQLSGDHCVDSEYRMIFRGFARRNGIELIDLFPVFCELRDWPEYFIDGDIHWNARGHELVAERLFDRIGDALRRNAARDSSRADRTRGMR
ncbi:MAG: GDSL-type esterase/lipase family protein [Myxococcota bacterium]